MIFFNTETQKGEASWSCPESLPFLRKFAVNKGAAVFELDLIPDIGAVDNFTADRAQHVDFGPRREFRQNVTGPSRAGADIGIPIAGGIYDIPRRG